MKKLNCLFVVFLIFSTCDSQFKKNEITIKGTIGNSFHLSTSHTIEINKREEFLMSVKDISDRIEKLDRYFEFINEGKEDQAKSILQSDSTLLKMSQFEIAYSYTIVKMKELDILFLPLIQCNHHMISITEEELKLLDNFLIEKIEVELVIEKIGDIEMDNTTYYKLNRIEK